MGLESYRLRDEGSKIMNVNDGKRWKNESLTRTRLKKSRARTESVRKYIVRSYKLRTVGASKCNKIRD